MAAVAKQQQQVRESYLYSYTSSDLKTDTFDKFLLSTIREMAKTAINADGSQWEKQSGVENENLQKEVSHHFKKNKTTAFPVKFVNIRHKGKSWFLGRRYNPTLIHMYEKAFNDNYAITYVTQRNSVGSKVAHELAVAKVLEEFMKTYLAAELEYYKQIRQSTSGDKNVH